MNALSAKQMKILQEKGLDCDNASYYWLIDHGCNYTILLSKNENIVMKTPEDLPDEERVPAFSLDDILDILPQKIERNSKKYQWVLFNNSIAYWCNGNLCIQFDEKTRLDSAYKLLIWCLDNNYINERILDRF